MMAYFRYWGKTSSVKADDNTNCHLLPYHSLDVATVAGKWWDSNPVIRNAFISALGGCASAEVVRAWVLYFIALHDIGKFDLRFQLKSVDGLRSVRSYWVAEDCSETTYSIHNYDHGLMGYFSAYRDFKGSRFIFAGSQWLDWLAAATGHHGVIPGWEGKGFHPPNAEDDLVELDKAARLAWYQEAAELFLRPAGIAPDDCQRRFDFA